MPVVIRHALEGAHFWLGALNDLRHQGVQDILITCIDGLKGFPQGIETIFPRTTVQLCMAHQIRNTLKHVAHKDKKPFMADLKTVYQASTKKIAETNLLLMEKNGEKNILLFLNPGIIIGIISRSILSIAIKFES